MQHVLYCQYWRKVSHCCSPKPDWDYTVVTNKMSAVSLCSCKTDSHIYSLSLSACLAARVIISCVWWRAGGEWRPLFSPHSSNGSCCLPLSVHSSSCSVSLSLLLFYFVHLTVLCYALHLIIDLLKQSFRNGQSCACVKQILTRTFLKK